MNLGGRIYSIHKHSSPVCSLHVFPWFFLSGHLNGAGVKGLHLPLTSPPTSHLGSSLISAATQSSPMAGLHSLPFHINQPHESSYGGHLVQSKSHHLVRVVQFARQWLLVMLHEALQRGSSSQTENLKVFRCPEHKGCGTHWRKTKKATNFIKFVSLLRRVLHGLAC